jgi:hypothetical protein
MQTTLFAQAFETGAVALALLGALGGELLLIFQRLLKGLKSCCGELSLMRSSACGLRKQRSHIQIIVNAITKLGAGGVKIDLSSC